jgi:mercuric ion binding protein
MSKILISAAVVLLTAPVWASSQTVTLSIPTMNCPVCPITVKKALIKVPGVSQAEVSLEKRLAIVTYDDARTSVEVLTRATRNAGYPSTPRENAK